MTDERTVHMAQAEQCLRSCKLLLEHEDTNGAVNRLYYALFHAASAALDHRGVEIPKTHSGLISRFGVIFVKTGAFPAELGKLLNQVEHERLLADYAGDEPDPALLPALITQTERFLKVVGDLLDA